MQDDKDAVVDALKIIAPNGDNRGKNSEKLGVSGINTRQCKMCHNHKHIIKQHEVRQ